MSASNRYHDGRAADTQSMVYAMPDNSAGRAPLCAMSNDEIYPAALEQMPKRREEDGGMEMLVHLLIYALAVASAAVWAVIHFWS